MNIVLLTVEFLVYDHLDVIFDIIYSVMNERVKYPRTYHLPWSEGRTDDDKVLSDDSQFIGKYVIVTEKMDGENTTIYSDGYLHARSIDSRSKPWQSWLQAYAQSFCHFIPGGWRICGENLYAKHSISYDKCWSSNNYLFQAFSVYDYHNVCLSWYDTLKLCGDFRICHVPEIYLGVYDRKAIIEKFKSYSKAQPHEVEGYVIRNANAFPYDMFSSNVAKFVRAHHVQTDEHWTKHWEKTKLS